MKPRHLASMLLLSLVLLTACRYNPDARLEAVNAMASESPRRALASLDSIDPSGLDEYNRHFYDFLKIKAADKAYITHTTDSLYLSVLNYFSSHKDSPLYPEVVYYGGRVYSDMGDYPTALDYYHQVLELLLDDADNYDLKIRALSQTGDIFDNLRVYDKANRFAREALDLSSKFNDTLNIIKCNQVLGGIHLRTLNYEEAEKYYKNVDYLITDTSSIESMNSRLYRAAIKLQKGDIDSALYLIKGLPERVIPVQQNNANLYASRIYLKAGDTDRAYYYANQLIKSKKNLNRRKGYEILFSADLIEKLNKDSLIPYMEDYRRLLNSDFNKNSAELTLLQESLYNYRLHEREKEKAEKANAALKLIIGMLILSLSISVIVILLIKNRNKAEIIELHETIDAVSKLSQSFDNSKGDENEIFSKKKRSDAGKGHDDGSYSSVSGSLQDLRAKLRQELFSLSLKQNEIYKLDEMIASADVYLKLQDYLNRHIPLEVKNPIWGDIEKLVLSVSPLFRKNLFLLTGGRLTIHDYHTALLIKLNISPTKMSILLGRGRGTINSRRATLCMKVFDENKGLKVIDTIIKQL